MGAAAKQIAQKGTDTFFTTEKVSVPIFIPRVLADWADAQLARLGLAHIGGAQLLTERAAIAGFGSRGRISPGGSCRLLDAAGGGVALNVARDEDWSLLPAWLEVDAVGSWTDVEALVRERPARELVARGREMGLAVAVDEIPEPRAPAVPRLARPSRLARGARVVDLSSLWAGPLCSHLLQQLGCEVVKVESIHRPDGARRGPSTFFDLLNAGKASVALDFRTAEGRAQLEALVDSADVVIEGSRPRALRQLGIDAEATCARKPELTWIGITAYGRSPATENWIGYGDDVGVAAGLTARVRERTGETRIVGDAIADPLTGIAAAVAAVEQRGLVDVAMFAWGQMLSTSLGACREPLTPCPRPPLRRPAGIARELGADTVAQLRLLQGAHR